MSKGPIVSCVAEGRAAVTVFEGVVRLRDRHGVKETLVPVTSLRDVEGQGVLQRASALVTDLRSPANAGVAQSPEEADALEQILSTHPSLPAIVLAEASAAVPLITDPELPIREVVLRDEEDDPATVALLLVRLRVSLPEREVLERVPRHLPSPYHLALARALRPSRRFPGEKECIQWSGRDQRVTRRDFRRAGLREPGECMILMRLVAAMEAVHRRGRDVEDAAQRYGFTNRETLDQVAERLTNSNARSIVDGGSWELVLEHLQGWMWRCAEVEPLEVQDSPLAERRPRRFPTLGIEPDQAKAKELATVEELYRVHREVALREALRLQLSRDQAEDVVSEVFTEFCERIERGEPLSERRLSRGYILRAIRNRTYNVLERSQLRRKRLEEGGHAVRGLQGTIEQPSSSESGLDAATRRLEEPYRLVARACLEQGWTSEIAAALLGVSTRKVAAWRNEARRRLRMYAPEPCS